MSYKFDANFSRVERNKFGKVSFGDLGDLDVELYPPKAQYLEDHILSPRGFCASKFLHALENDQVLLAHTPTGTLAPFTSFFIGGSKIGIKCNKCPLITSELRGVARRTFGTRRDSRLGC